MLIKRKQYSKDYFENLILKVDSLNNIETYIVKYTLNAPLKYYSEHESFSIDAQPEIRRIYLENTADLIVARSTCISVYGTRCNGTLNSGCTGAWHTPGPNCQCVVIYESGLDCSTEGDDPGGGGIIDDDFAGGGGGISEGVVTAPNVDAYLWELKNFTSGELNRAQRSYYNSNGNIKNNINTYLISKNFSVFSILESKLAINVGMALSLDYKVFNWAFKNSNQILKRASQYLSKNENSSEAVAFAKQSIIVAKQGGEVDFEDLNSYVSLSPLIKYPKGSNYDKLYPKLTEYLKNQIPKLGDNLKIINTIRQITGLSTARIKKDLQWGSGPTLNIIQLDNFASNTTSTTLGAFDGNRSESDIYLDIDYVNTLERYYNSQGLEDAWLFLLGVTILHEYVHFGDHIDSIDYPGEEGSIFELKVYGHQVNTTNAIITLNEK